MEDYSVHLTVAPHRFSVIWTHSVRAFWVHHGLNCPCGLNQSILDSIALHFNVLMSNARTGVSPHGLIMGPPRSISIHSPNLALCTTTESVSTWTQLWLIVAFEIALFGLGLSPHHTPPMGSPDYRSGPSTQTQSSVDLTSSIQHRK